MATSARQRYDAVVRNVQFRGKEKWHLALTPSSVPQRKGKQQGQLLSLTSHSSQDSASAPFHLANTTLPIFQTGKPRKKRALPKTT